LKRLDAKAGKHGQEYSVITGLNGMILLEIIVYFVYNALSHVLSGDSSGDCCDELTGAYFCAPEERL
jgi:hypothetical protein